MYSRRRLPRAQRRHVAVATCFFLCLFPCLAYGQATTYTWNGSVDSDFNNLTNWGTAGIAETDNATTGAVNARISVQNGSYNPLVYTAAQGHTLYNSSGRSLFIGSGADGAIEITGGIFESQASQEDGMANGSVASLTINGGQYVNNTSGNQTFLVTFGGTATGTLNMLDGAFTVTTLKYQGGSSANGIVNLDGGIMSVKSIVDGGGNSTFNFNGGTLTPLDDTSELMQGLDAATVQAGGAIVDTSGFDVTIAQNLLDAGGGLTKSGSGRLVLSGANTYSGATVVDDGELRIANDSALSGTSGVTVSDGARLALASGATVSGTAITLTGTGGDNLGALRAVGGTAEWAGNVTITSSSTRLGAVNNGTLIVSGQIVAPSLTLLVRTDTPSSKVVLTNAANDYGSTDLVVGTLQIDGGDDRLSTGGRLRLGNTSNVSSTVFDLNGYNQEVAGLTTQGTTMSNTVTNTAGTLSTLTVNNSGADYSYDGFLTGNLALTKSGSKNLTLEAANTYTGGTLITAGQLVADADDALGFGDVTIDALAVLDLSSASLTTGAIDDMATLSLDSSGSDYAVVAFGSSTLDEIVGSLLIDGVAQAVGTYTQADLPNYITGAGSITVVPESSTLLLAVFGLLSLAFYGWRRNR